MAVYNVSINISLLLLAQQTIKPGLCHRQSVANSCEGKHHTHAHTGPLGYPGNPINQRTATYTEHDMYLGRFKIFRRPSPP